MLGDLISKTGETPIPQEIWSKSVRLVQKTDLFDRRDAYPTRDLAEVCWTFAKCLISAKVSDLGRNWIVWHRLLPKYPRALKLKIKAIS